MSDEKTELQAALAKLRCDVCRNPGADACIRMASGSPGEPKRSIYGHEKCARDRGIIPLYRLTGLPIELERAQ